MCTTPCRSATAFSTASTKPRRSRAAPDHVGQALRALVRLRPAAAHGADRPGVFAHQPPQRLAGLAPALGRDGAGVDDYAVRRLAVLRGAVPPSGQYGLHGLRFILVDLAAQGVYNVLHRILLGRCGVSPGTDVCAMRRCVFALCPPAARGGLRMPPAFCAGITQKRGLTVEIYLDNAATTRVCPEAAEAAMNAMRTITATPVPPTPRGARPKSWWTTRAGASRRAGCEPRGARLYILRLGERQLGAVVGRGVRLAQGRACHKLHRRA